MKNVKKGPAWNHLCAVLSYSVMSDSFVAPWTVAHQAPLWGFSRPEYCSGLPCPFPGDLPDPGIEPRSPALQADSLLSEPQRTPNFQIHSQVFLLISLVSLTAKWSPRYNPRDPSRFLKFWVVLGGCMAELGFQPFWCRATLLIDGGWLLTMSYAVLIARWWQVTSLLWVLCIAYI